MSCCATNQKGFQAIYPDEMAYFDALDFVANSKGILEVNSNGTFGEGDFLSRFSKAAQGSFVERHFTQFIQYGLDRHFFSGQNTEKMAVVDKAAFHIFSQCKDYNLDHHRDLLKVMQEISQLALFERKTPLDPIVPLAAERVSFPLSTAPTVVEADKKVQMETSMVEIYEEEEVDDSEDDIYEEEIDDLEDKMPNGNKILLTAATSGALITTAEAVGLLAMLFLVFSQSRTDVKTDDPPTHELLFLFGSLGYISLAAWGGAWLLRARKIDFVAGSAGFLATLPVAVGLSSMGLGRLSLPLAPIVAGGGLGATAELIRRGWRHLRS